ncbi:MAG: glutamate--cysteine ligase, partial [Gammaproteobacteria bacterium]
LLEQPNIDHQLTFEMARENFYAAARLGLEADAVWNDGEALPIRELIMHTLLPLAARGLESQGIDQTEIDRWLGIVRDRVESGINGAQWQRRWVQEHGKDWEGLTRAYARQCHGGRPVHDWDFGQ